MPQDGLSYKNKKHDVILTMIKATCILLNIALFAVCWGMYYKNQILIPFYNKGNLVVILIYCLIYFYFLRVYEALLISMKRIRDLVFSQFLSIGFTDAIIYIIICVLARKMVPLLPGMACFVTQFGVASLWAFFANRLYYVIFPAQRSVIIYDDRQDIEKMIDHYGLGIKYSIQSIVNIGTCLADYSILDGIDVVFLSGIHSHERNVLLKYCIERGIRAFVIPRIGDAIMSGAKKVHFFHIPLLQVERYRPSIDYLIIKRLMDILFSICAVILLSPIMVAIAIAIKLEDRGSVFYKQDRLTKNGKVFKLIKFRSMRMDAEKDGIPRLSAGDKDDRITNVGKIIRKLRLDELPQLFNIICGEMSLIGPRPERPEIAEQYEKILPEFHLRLQAKAGLTGYAQVYGKYNTSPYDKLQMDLLYLANPSIIEDISIFFATIRILFVPESTDGIDDGQITALDYNQGANDKTQDEEP